MPGQPIRGMTNLPSHKPDRQQAGPASTATRKPFKQLKLIDVGLSLSLSLFRSSLSFLSLSLSLSPSHYIFLSFSLSLSLLLSFRAREIYRRGGAGRWQASNQETARRPGSHLDTQISSQPSMDPGSQPTGQPQPAASLSVSPSLSLSQSLKAEERKRSSRLAGSSAKYIYGGHVNRQATGLKPAIHPGALAVDRPASQVGSDRPTARLASG